MPIFEFVTEVAGVKPVRPGWVAIEFRPRTALYEDVEATVPLRMVDGKVQGLAHDAWGRALDVVVRVSFRLEGEGTECVPVDVFVPGAEMAVKNCTAGVEIVLEGGK